MLTQSSQVWTELSLDGAQKDNKQDSTVRYLISSKWWEKWRDFTNFNQDFLTGGVTAANLTTHDDQIQSGYDDINIT